MLGAARKNAAELRALEQVMHWTRERFKLPQETVVLVSELACTQPGCPPLETVVAFWTADATRHSFKIFKPVTAITTDDLPYAWLMKSLAVPEGFMDDCC